MTFFEPNVVPSPDRDLPPPPMTQQVVPELPTQSEANSAMKRDAFNFASPVQPLQAKPFDVATP